jgi:GAF domain-containing protein
LSHFGFPVGALSILDTQPHELSPTEQDLLKMIAADVMEQIKRRRVPDTPDTLKSEKS